MAKRLIILGVSLLMVLAVRSQTLSRTSTQKNIGLVLSGGGAKGMAHIGLLKLIDSLNLNVSFVGGTSMGSIMGSLYAIGYSGKEIEQRCLAMNWPHLFSDRVPYEKITIEEKMDQNRYLLELPFKNGRLKLPAGVIRGPNLYNEFVKLSFPVIDKPNWDSFPIPLRINAVNILNGSNVVFSSGFLPPRMRASMSIPSIFMPIEVDTCYFVDGGVVRNILIPEVKASKPDYMIGSYTGGALMSMDELNTLPKLMGQTFTIYGILDAMNEEKELNLISKPDLRGLDAGSFAKAPLIIQRGIESAARLRDTLVKLAADSAYLRRKPIAQPHNDAQILHEAFYVDDIKVQGISKTTFNFFNSTLGFYQGDTASLQQLFDGVLALYGSMHYDFVTYSMEFKGYTPGGRKIITLNFAVNESPNLSLRLAVNHNSDFSTGLTLGVLGRNILFKNTRLLFEGTFSEKPRGKFSYYWYADKHLKWLLGTTNYFEVNEVSNYNKKVASEIFRVNVFNSYSWIQYKFDYRHGLSLGYELNMELLKPKIYSDESYDLLKHIRTNRQSALLQYQFNTLNRQALPTHGFLLNMKARYVFSAVTKAKFDKSVANEAVYYEGFFNYPEAQLILENYLPLHKRLTWLQRFYGGAQFLDQPNDFDYTFLGSAERNSINALPLYGYRRGEVNASTFTILETGLQFNPWKDLYLNGGVEAAVISSDYRDFGKEFSNIESNSVGHTSSFYAGIAYLVPRLGPVSFTVHKSFDRRVTLNYFSIGYRFQIP